MTRPLMQLGVRQLEELFARSKTDQKVLKQLDFELQNRKVPRAVSLHAEVQAAMNGETTAPHSAASRAAFQTPTALTDQSGSWDRQAQLSAQVSALEPVSPVVCEPPMARQSEIIAIAESIGSPLSTIPIEDAFRLLKATASSSWESIEHTRRALVLQSHPERLKGIRADKRSDALAEAKRVNEAYAALSLFRGAGR